MGPDCYVRGVDGSWARVKATIGLSTRDSEGQRLITCVETDVDNVKATSKRVYTGIDSVRVRDQILNCSVEIEAKVMTKASVELSSIGAPVTSTLGASSRAGISICCRSKSQKIGSSPLHDEEEVLLKRMYYYERVTQTTRKKAYQNMRRL